VKRRRARALTLIAKACFYAEFIPRSSIFTEFLYARTYIWKLGASLGYGDSDMKSVLERVKGGPDAAVSLDGVYLSRRTRARAQAYLYKADRITNVVIRAIGKIRMAIAWLERSRAKSTQQAASALVERDPHHV
jgi:hypothetical protein